MIQLLPILFCGFYVNGAGGEMYNDATQVVLMREGTRTVLSMQNSYQGPVEDFAMVIPVPVVLQEGDVKTLNKEVFQKVDLMGSPRLVEYWEEDPCNPYMYLDEGKMGKKDSARAEGQYKMKKNEEDYGVTIEAKFVVGEYQIVILSAKDSAGLDGYLRAEKYKIPDGAEPLLRPYVEEGSKFFVAKVDPTKVTFDSDGRAQLSPLRFHYDSEAFALPIRLGLAASPGKQDLIVTILSTEGRYQVSNYKNVTIPTNLDVKDEVRNRFAEFYVALFDRTIEQNPGAVVTEYSWASSSCDPCPGPQLDYHDLDILGNDVLGSDGWSFVMTRLHARYGPGDVPDDLVFAKAKPIVGGREIPIDDKGTLEEGSREDSQNNFQGRYIIRHEWTGPIACADPQRGIWGGPPDGGRAPISGGRDLAHAPRGKVKLPEMVMRDVPELQIRAAGARSAPAGDGSRARGGNEPSSPTRYGKGCGCTSTNGSSALWMLGLLALSMRRRKS